MPWATFAIVASIAFTAGAALSWVQSVLRDPSTVEGLLWPDPPELAPFNLTNQDGDPFTLDQLRGKWSLLFFGFTSCPDVCPMSLDALARANGELKTHDNFGAGGQVVFISVDPERDSPKRIGEYVRHFDPEFLGVTAPVEELQGLARSLGALFMKIPQGGDAYTMDHSAGIFIVDPDLRLVSVLTPPHSAAAIVRRFDAVSEWIESNP